MNIDIDSAAAWTSHVAKVEAILRIALRQLRDDGLSGNETHLNRELYFRILRANKEIYRVTPEQAFSMPPVPEAQNTPSRDDDERDPRTKKIPDFQWNYIDHEAADPEKSVCTYVIECKKLGTPTRADWNFNSNYAEHGVRRFVDPSHLYGKDAVGGAMIGYVLSMELPEIHDEVDAAVVVNSIAAVPTPAAGWQVGDLSEIRHTLARTHGVSPYQLTHFWIDMRTERV
jgi:hypothetical protein